MVTEDILILTNSIIGFLFLMSEYLAYSKCDINSVSGLLLQKMCLGSFEEKPNCEKCAERKIRKVTFIE